MSKTILIVEDDENMANLEKRLLEKEGFRVLMAGEGKAALDLACTEPRPDLMVIDYLLPGMSGVDLMREVNDSHAGNLIPAIILTAAGSESVAVAAMKLGAMDYIIKDIETVMQLPAICKDVLRKAELDRENARLMERLKEINEELKETNKRLEDISRRDDLTGLYNRRYMMEVLEHECALSHRYGTPLCFALFDLDHFKEVNDTYGHPVGDAVLRQMAGIFRVRLRKTDRVFRYGGEEFGVVFAGIGRAEAFAVCEELRQTVEVNEFTREDVSVKLTISAGLAVMREHMSHEDLIDKADKSLYLAKDGGRNRVASVQED